MRRAVMIDDDDLIMISALQHYSYCPRQCALIHLEQVWHENVFTMEGRLLHDRAHSIGTERRSAKKKAYGTPVRSLQYGITGRTDIIEFEESGSVIPVEYKRGGPKKGQMDAIQLCAQALCLEEMLNVSIEKGYCFYGKKRRRQEVAFDDALRGDTVATIQAVRRFLEHGRTPTAAWEPSRCRRCSLIDQCLPRSAGKGRSAQAYLRRMLLTLEDAQ